MVEGPNNGGGDSRNLKTHDSSGKLPANDPRRTGSGRGLRCFRRQETHVSSARLSRWARRFLLASAAWFVLAQVVVLTGGPRRVEVVLGLYGFVLTTVFGKAYSLVPSYFDRTLAWSSAPMVQLPLTTGGVVALGLAGYRVGPAWLRPVGALLWVAGVVVFLATLLVTIGDNITGAETGTGDANADRRPLDRLANAAVPVVLLYLLAGCVELLAWAIDAPSPFGGLAVSTSHLFATGVALLLLFAVGYRLLPRFLVVYPSRALAGVTLGLGVLGPGLLAWGYPAGPVFRAGAVVESLAVLGFAGAYGRMYVRTDRDRVGRNGPLAGVALGCLGVGLGVSFAFTGVDAALGVVHRRLNLFGLLGLSIIGAVYQFYPPAVCPWPGGSDRTALASLVLVAGGLALTVLAAFTRPVFATAGHALVLLGGLTFSYLLAGAIHFQKQRGA